MSLLHRLRHLIRRPQSEAEMAEEMRFHLEQRAEDLATAGLPGDKARLAAQRRFGNVAAIQERARDTFGWGALERFAQDLRFAVRQLIRSPGFALLAILTLGLGIGANTAMFGMIQTILFKPLPYPGSGQLVRIYRATAQNRLGHLAPADYLDFRRAAAGLGAVAAYLPANASLSDPGNPAELAYAARVGANFFDLLGLAICSLLAKANPAMRMNSAPVLVGATLLLVSVALFACRLPAQRTRRINAIDALRAE